MNRAFDSRAVIERAVRGAEILKDVLIAFATHFSMDARRERIGNAKIVASGAADSYTKPAEWKMVWSAIGVFNYEL
jgi:hypothetical protein